MNTLANPDDKKLLLERVAKLRTDSPRAWGKMSPHQMVCHLCDSSRLALGEKQARSVSNLFKRTVMKWVALALPAPWPRGIKTMPEFDQNIGGTPPAEFEKDRSILISLTERLAKQPASVAAAVHPFLPRWRSKNGCVGRGCTWIIIYGSLDADGRTASNGYGSLTCCRAHPT